MSTFTNTVDSIGNEALTNSIIDRSITEIADNIADAIGASVFRGCSALESVNFPSVKSVGIAAFWNCSKLKKAEFAECVSFANNAFYGCTQLEALILRCTDQVCTCGSSFSSSAIASGTGYIYVPSALMSTYKATSGWSSYVNQFRAIEDYPEIVDPYSWTAVFKAIDNGTYASVYKVGDLVPLDLGSEGVVNMEIVGFDVDTLADGSGNAPISWISKELLKSSHRMNPALVTNADGTYQEGTGTIGGWPKCEMRTYLNDTIKPLIPVNVAAMIKTVTKYSDCYDTSGAEVDSAVSEDSVWIPSSREFGYTFAEKTGAKYPSSGVLEKQRFISGTSSLGDLFLRSAYSNVHSFAYIRGFDGYFGYTYASIAENFLLGFCT